MARRDGRTAANGDAKGEKCMDKDDTDLVLGGGVCLGGGKLVGLAQSGLALCDAESLEGELGATYTPN